jgi:glycosyltransferase involved in cell wall biosynthesis
MVGADIIPGGHRVQLEQTCKHLIELGIEAEVSFAPEPDLTSYDILHGFSMTPESMRRCREYRVPVAFSTIYWGREYTTGQHYTGKKLEMWVGRARKGAGLLRSALQGRSSEKCEALVEHLQSMRVVCEMADILLPNSRSEANALKSELGVTTPCHVVPNSVDPTQFKISDAVEASRRDYVLFSGRFEPHKNQLGLIRAMKGSNIPIKLVGHPHPHHPDYYEQCRRLATGNISILPGVPHDDLVPLYQGARVHVLPSWFETTGLVSLEAALCGCNIVTTNRGYAHDYFQDMAWYCDPANPASIRQAIEAAYHAPPQPELRERILNEFTWKHTAQATVEGYHKILSQP